MDRGGLVFAGARMLEMRVAGLLSGVGRVALDGLWVYSELGCHFCLVRDSFLVVYCDFVVHILCVARGVSCGWEGFAVSSEGQSGRRLWRSSATARAAAPIAPMTVAAVEQLIEARVSAALANHETLRNNTNGHGDGSYNSSIGNRGTTRTSREYKVEKYVGGLPDMI
ncbi:hypothetical protein Tco_1230741 [Tanacetum coccineum]